MKTITHIGQTMLFGHPGDEDAERGMVLDIQGDEVTVAWEQGAETTQSAEALGVALIPNAMYCDPHGDLRLPSGRVVNVTDTGIDADHYPPEVVAEFDAIPKVVLPDGTVIG